MNYILHLMHKVRRKIAKNVLLRANKRIIIPDYLSHKSWQARKSTEKICFRSPSPL